MLALGIAVPGEFRLHSAQESPVLVATRFGCNSNDSVANADAGATATENPSRNLDDWSCGHGDDGTNPDMDVQWGPIVSVVICCTTRKLIEKPSRHTLKVYGRLMKRLLSQLGFDTQKMNWLPKKTLWRYTESDLGGLDWLLGRRFRDQFGKWWV